MSSPKLFVIPEQFNSTNKVCPAKANYALFSTSAIAHTAVRITIDRLTKATLLFPETNLTASETVRQSTQTVSFDSIYRITDHRHVGLGLHINFGGSTTVRPSTRCTAKPQTLLSWSLALPPQPASPPFCRPPSRRPWRTELILGPTAQNNPTVDQFSIQLRIQRVYSTNNNLSPVGFYTHCSVHDLIHMNSSILDHVCRRPQPSAFIVIVRSRLLRNNSGNLSRFKRNFTETLAQV